MRINVPIIDGALAFDCPCSGEVHVLVLRNVIHVPSMDQNLIPPFIIRSGGVTINDVPKIHYKDPAVDDHYIVFDQSNLRTPLQLNRVFSCF